MGGKSTPAGNTTQTNTSIPFGSGYFYNGQVNSPNTIFGQAYNIGNTPISFPTFQTYASPTSQQNQAITAQTNLAQNDPTMQAATGGIQPYLNGSMLSAGNPYFGNVVSQLGQAIAPSIDSHFNMNGRAGSGANNQAFASALANQAGQMAYQNYSDQSQRQLGALMLAPQISQGNFSDIGQLASAGAQQQAFNQLPINQALQSYFYNQQAPYQVASEYESLLSGQGQTGTQSNPYFTNPVGSVLGTGIGALGLYNMGNQATGGALSNYLGGLFGGGAGGIGGAMGSGLSQDALNMLSADALSNVGAGAAGL